MSSHVLNRPLILALLCAAPTIAPSLLAQDKHDLKITAKKGDQAHFRVTAKQEQAMDMGGQQMESGSETVKEIDVKVLGVNDKGDVEVEVKVVSVKGKMSAPMLGDIEFDTTKKADDDDDDGGGGMMPTAGTLKKAFGFMAGKTIKATVSPDGSKITVQDAKELVAEANKKGTGAMGRMGGQISEASLAHEIEGLFGTFPAQATAIGGTWEKNETQQAQMGPGVGMTMATKSKLEKVEADRVRISFEGTVTMAKKEEKKETKKEGEEEGMEAQVRQAMGNMKIENGKISGWSEVSRKDGMIHKSESKTSMDMTMGEMMKMASKSTNTIERVAADAKAPDAKAPDAKAPASQPAKK